MGLVISIDNQEGESASVLTQTGKGGLLSSGYLRDEPANAHLQNETPVFVLTNQKRGVEIGRGGEREQVTPGSGYRTIAVVTDRRIVVLVGDSSHENVDGDQRLSVPFTEVESVTGDGGRRKGALTVERSGDTTWTIHAGGSGLSEVEAYIEAAMEAWSHVEETIDHVTRMLVNALDRRDRGEYDDALDAAQAAADQLEDGVRTARAFSSDWPGTAITERVQQVGRRCENTLATVRVGRARQFTDRAERRWRKENLEGAHDTYDRAKKEYDAIRSLSVESIDDWERVDAEAERVERTIERLEEAPLQAAIDADKAAQSADDPETAAEHLGDAIEKYERAIAVDQDAQQRRFAGDPEDIRKRLDEVVEEVTAKRRKAATKAKQAGEWYIGTDKYDLAVEEFETAREQFERAIDVASERYPDAVDHLEADLSAVEESLDRARAARDGDAVEPVETESADDEPDYDVEATIGTPTDEQAADEGNEGRESPPESTVDDGNEGHESSEGPTADDGIERELRRLDEERFGDIVAAVLAETGWSVEATTDETLVVSKDAPTTERMLVLLTHRPDGEPVDVETIERCSDLARERNSVDAVMVATSAGITDEVTRQSRAQQVRLLDDQCLAAVIESCDLGEELRRNRVELD